MIADIKGLFLTMYMLSAFAPAAENSSMEAKATTKQPQITLPSNGHSAIEVNSVDIICIPKSDPIMPDSNITFGR